MKDLHAMSGLARSSSYELAITTNEKRNEVLNRLADLLTKRRDFIFSANDTDLQKAREEHLAAPLVHRLLFRDEKLQQVIAGLHVLTEIPDPIGKTEISTEITEGLEMYRVRCPIGVIGIIFESRPDALVQISSLCIKSGNASLLKGGREALNTNKALCECVRTALKDSGLPEDAVQLLETRDDVNAMLREDQNIDLIIPRGSNSFVRYIMDNSRIPVLGHADGLCHVYIDKSANKKTAIRVAVDSKTQNVSVCNAAETFLIHREEEGILPELAQELEAAGVEMRGDEEVCNIIKCQPAEDKDWNTEYLDRIISIKIVDSLQEAIDHINHYGSHHTDCIITENKENAAIFLNRVDSAGVYWNVSTRFADGFVYGFGAEVGIATGKIHARGPMGLEGLTTYKFKLLGTGQTMSEMKNGTKQYTHKTLKKDCPI